LFASEGKEREAEVCYLKEIEINPSSSKAYNNLGALPQNSKNLEKQIEYYKKAIELDPKNLIAYCNLGDTLHALKRT